jgi:hypothetical protein
MGSMAVESDIHKRDTGEMSAADYKARAEVRGEIAATELAGGWLIGKLLKPVARMFGFGEEVAVAANGLHPLRQAYVDAVSELKPMADSLKMAGADIEALARALHAERRAIGEQFKALTPADKLAEIYERNLQKYGDKLGPTVDWLRAHGKSWDQIIESATRTGGKDLGF